MQMVRFHPGPLRLGRQLADHPRLERRMLRVRLPPEPLQKPHALVEQPGVLACLSRRRSWVQIPSGTLDKTARYANRQSGEAQTFVNVCGFESHPCYWRTTTRVGWALAGPAGCKPAVRKGSGGSTPSRRTPTRFVHGAVR